MTSGKRFKGVLFDLDGTLLDTAPDMAAALNQLLREENGTMLEYERLRPTVSHGARGLINAGFGATIDAGLRERLTERFLEIYAAALANETAPFAGVEQVLAALEESATPWGI
ncbi:MAG: HAD hydrolase-like protein, partial [Gammaproteobacteria bacterium]|nr:HAD hydrolase-like protein [Gammaproteobacteria bacterium]